MPLHSMSGVAANLLAGEMLASMNGDWRPVFGTAVAVLFLAFPMLAKGHPVLVPLPTHLEFHGAKMQHEDHE